MIAFPNCKINIGLNIISKRTDGYHDLETVFYPVQIKDIVEIIVSNDPSKGILFTSSGNAVAGNEDDNLCIKAYRLLKKDFPQIPAVKMHLHKNIPMGAGLGGGSADASAVLTLLNNKFELNIAQEQLMAYALQLGSDCPFFLLNKPAFASGRGENLSPVAVDLSGYKILIVHPGIHVHTGKAFGGLNPEDFSPAGQLQEALKQDITQWKDLIKNDFEKPVFALHPQIRQVKEQMYESGAVYSSMSGSGSAVFGVFPADVLRQVQHDLRQAQHDKNNLKFPSHYFCQIV
jgi:4-diphosphocytidyl-2-C-methyl-D-erythritol kinase